MNNFKQLVMIIVIGFGMTACGGGGGTPPADSNNQNSYEEVGSETEDNGGNVDDLNDTQEDTGGDTVLTDNTDPVLTLNGDATITVVQGETYSDPGATATDNYDGDLTSNIIITGSVDTNTIGTYTIVYTVKDSAGNSASTSRTVTVVIPPDTTAPVITLNGDETVTLKQFDNYVEQNATATDDRDGNVTVSIIGTVNTDVAGVYTITYVAADHTGNEASKTRMITVNKLPDYKIKKTGVTESYNNGGTLITDGSIKDDGYYQTGITPKYIRDNTEGIVTDVITSLQWQDNEVVQKNIPDALGYCNSLTLGGKDDWRLPSTKELQGLIDYNKMEHIPSGTPEKYLYDNTFNVVADVYWSSDEITDFTYSYHFSVNFSSQWGETDGSDDSSILNVRCVRGNTTTASSLTRNDDLEIVEDNATRLMWQDDLDTANASTTSNWKTWEYAVAYCEDLSLGGYDDWRLPSVNELLSIVDYETRMPALSLVFENIKGTGGENRIYWSSTTSVNQPESAWRVNFKSGTSYYANLKTFNHDVRCVRDY